MKAIVLIAAALAISTTASAQSVRRHDDRANYDRVVRQPAGPSWTAPIDNARPPFAAHIGANGQGVD